MEFLSYCHPARKHFEYLAKEEHFIFVWAGVGVEAGGGVVEGHDSFLELAPTKQEELTLMLKLEQGDTLTWMPVEITEGCEGSLELQTHQCDPNEVLG